MKTNYVIKPHKRLIENDFINDAFVQLQTRTVIL